jgi:hypothetical protein
MFYFPPENERPSDREIRKAGGCAATFYSWIDAMFQGRVMPEPSDDGADWRIEAMRRRDETLKALNAPKPPGPPSLMSAVATHAVDAVREVVKKVKPRDKARQWLMSTLSGGPMLAEVVKEMAKAAKISGRTLRRAFESGNFGHAKNADGLSVWSQPQAEKQDGQS